jgi:hypothetical protein
MDVEHCSRLKVKFDDDRVFVGRRGGGDELRGRGWGRRRLHTLTGSCSRLLRGGGLRLLEEAGVLDAATRSGGLHLDVLGLLDDGLKLAQRAATSVSSGMVTARDREPAAK